MTCSTCPWSQFTYPDRVKSPVGDFDSEGIRRVIFRTNFPKYSLLYDAAQSGITPEKKAIKRKPKCMYVCVCVFVCVCVCVCVSVCVCLEVGSKLRHSDVVKYFAVVLGGLLFTIATVVTVVCVAIRRHKLSPGQFITTLWCFLLIPGWYHLVGLWPVALFCSAGIIDPILHRTRTTDAWRLLHRPVIGWSLHILEQTRDLKSGHTTTPPSLLAEQNVTPTHQGSLYPSSFWCV